MMKKRVLMVGICAAMSCAAPSAFAQDANPRMLESLNMLGYCYQFPAMFKESQAAINHFNMDDLESIQEKYIELVLTAPEGSQAYITRKALEAGRKRFMDDVTFLAQADLMLKQQECSAFLGNYIQRVIEIENRQVPATPID